MATALFANSPFKEGKPTGYLSWRSHVWGQTQTPTGEALKPLAQAPRAVLHVDRGEVGFSRCLKEAVEGRQGGPGKRGRGNSCMRYTWAQVLPLPCRQACRPLCRLHLKPCPAALPTLVGTTSYAEPLPLTSLPRRCGTLPFVFEPGFGFER